MATAKKAQPRRASANKVQPPKAPSESVVADDAWPGKPPPLDPWPGKNEWEGDDAWPGKPPPLDPWPGKNEWDYRRFIVDIDWSIPLSGDAISRIERQLRQAVFAELAQVEMGSMLVRSGVRERAWALEVHAQGAAIR